MIDGVTDPTTRVVIETIRASGYALQVNSHAVTAIHKCTGEQFVVSGKTLYDAACELATQVGIELEDG